MEPTDEVIDVQPLCTEIVPAGEPVAPGGLVLLSDPVALKGTLAKWADARKVFIEWVFSTLVAGVDYQLIHRKVGPKGNKDYCPNDRDHASRHCQRCGGKATLCKPGSEKIAGLLQLRPVFVRDTDTWEMIGSRPGVIALVCQLMDGGGRIVAEGRGVRSQDQDYGDLNKTVKMCQKSAQTDAILRLGGLSEIFTQDIEDMPSGAAEAPRKAEEPKPAPKPSPAPSRVPETLTAAEMVPEKRSGVVAEVKKVSAHPKAPWRITMEGGDFGQTFSDTVWKAAEESKATGVPLRYFITITHDGKYTNRTFEVIEEPKGAPSGSNCPSDNMDEPFDNEGYDEMAGRP